ncbi:MAG: NADH-quinone oxidoreductase subunit C [Lachnospiraceae bacterium]|nr:NADH-quinone oxidoreductase subunit C [Lachnospiraceae bacterium]
MAEVIHPAEVIEEISAELLLNKVMEKKKAGMRLSQACAAFVDGNFELSYSFADDTTYEYETLRVVIQPETEIPSITDIVPPALFYENEMKELFGVKIRMISLDYNNKLYRIREETPLGPQTSGQEAAEAKNQA